MVVGGMAAIIMAMVKIVMGPDGGGGIDPAAQMGGRGKMDRDVIEVEGEKHRH